MGTPEAILRPGAEIPSEFVAVPFLPDATSMPLRPCVLFRRGESGPVPIVSYAWNHLRYHGCVTDCGGRVVEFLEVLVQSPSRVAFDAAQTGWTWTNISLEQQWSAQVRAWKASSDMPFLTLGDDLKAPLPTWLDPIASRAVVLPEWHLCDDDAMLGQLRLPVFSGSLHRYLAPTGPGSVPTVVPVSPAAPSNQATRSLDTLLPDLKNLYPFNPECGRIFVRRLPRFSHDWGSHVRLLSGAGTEAWASETGETTGLLPPPFPGSAAPISMMSARSPLARRTSEILFLKLSLFHEAVRATSRQVQELKTPHLGISDRAFVVSLSNPTPSLPLLWSARAELVAPSTAIPLSDAEGQLLGYRSWSANRPQSSPADSMTGSLRFRSCTPAPQNRFALECTLATDDGFFAVSTDTVTLHLPVRGGPICLVGKVSPKAQSEWKFVSEPTKAEHDLLRRFVAGEPVPGIDHVGIRVAEVLTAAWDMQALAHLGIGTLLLNSTNNITTLLDDFGSLARAVGRAGSGPLPERVRSVLVGESRLAELGDRLHSRHLWWHPPETPLSYSDEWLDLLSTLLRAIPGGVRESYCHNLGDASLDTPHAAFEGLLTDLARLAAQIRSNVLREQGDNSAIRRTIASIRTSLSKSHPPSGAKHR